MMTEEMKSLLKQIADLCYKASEEVFDNEETKLILSTCDTLAEQIDEYLETTDRG